MSASKRFESNEFRRALGSFACGVTIVTAAAPRGEKVGVTANSFNSVSLDPPLILWSLDKRSSAWETFKSAKSFAVNILASDQIELSNQFARPSEDKYAGIEFTEGFSGAPLFSDCAANFQCSLFDHIDAGDHWILIGKVEEFQDFGRQPLLYHQGSYAVTLAHPHGAKSKDDSGTPRPLLLDTQLGENIFYLMIQAVNATHPRFVQDQLALGLRNIESRLLMVLDSAEDIDDRELQLAVSAPPMELQEAMETLRSKGYLDGRTVTASGAAQLEKLWQIVKSAEKEMLEGLKDAEIDLLKKALKQVVSAHPASSAQSHS